MTILLIAMNDEGNDVLLAYTLCQSIIVVERKLLYFWHTLDVGIVPTLLNHLITECEFIHPFTIATQDKAN